MIPAGLLDEARRVADVTLFEGFVLYPYRATARKNQLRWQFGVLTPPGWSGTSGERTASRTECLLEPRGERPRVHVQVRFLHAVQRQVERIEGDGFVPVGALDLTDRVVLPFDDAEVRETELTADLADLAGSGVTRPVDVRGGSDEELLRDGGRLAGRLRRTWRPLTGVLAVRAERLPGPYGAQRLTVTLRNATTEAGTRGTREQALRHSMIAAHVLLGLTDARFLSLLDPPEWAAPAAAACVNDGSWPVLVGDVYRRDVVLASPIILYDHPRLAPQSPGELYDALEIDEILSLRTQTLTDEEKRQARGTGPRAAAVVDRVDAMPQEVLDRLHGTIRYLRDTTGTVPEYHEDVPWWDPGADASVSPETDAVLVGGVPIRRGSQVRLRPLLRGADAQDAFLVGRTATVEAVLHDVDEDTHLAVTVDDDPGADLQRTQGRFLYFRPDEVEPLRDGARS